MSEFSILGLFGPAGSGKDLVADWFVKEKNFVKVAYADPMKRFVRKLFSVEIQQLWGPSEERNRFFDVTDQWWLNAYSALRESSREITEMVLLPSDKVKGYAELLAWMSWLRDNFQKNISARIILQTLGTEWGRSIDPVMWARYGIETAKNLETGWFAYDQHNGVSTKREPANFRGVMISDHRYQNEIATLQEAGGHVIRLRRRSLEAKDETIGLMGHGSETAGKTAPDNLFDCVLELEEGIDKVHEILETAYEAQLWKVKSPSRGMASITMRIPSSDPSTPGGSHS